MKKPKSLKVEETSLTFPKFKKLCALCEKSKGEISFRNTLLCSTCISSLKDVMKKDG